MSDGDRLEKQAAERYKRLMQRKVDARNKRAASIAKDFLSSGRSVFGPELDEVRQEVLTVLGQKPADSLKSYDPNTVDELRGYFMKSMADDSSKKSDKLDD